MNINTYYSIESADRKAGSSTDFKLTLSEPLKNVTGIELQNLILPATFYNVTSLNNRIDYFDSGYRSITITPGFYTITNLCQTITTLLGGSYSCNYSGITFKVTIANTAGVFRLSFGTGANSIGATLGFDEIDLDGFSSYTAVVAPRISVNYINMSIKEIPTTIVDSAADTGLFQIVSKASGGEIVQYSKNNDFEQKIKFASPINISNLSISLTKMRLGYNNGIVITSLNNTFGWFYGGFNNGSWIQNGMVMIPAATYTLPTLAATIQNYFNSVDNITPNNWTISSSGNSLTIRRQNGPFGIQGSLMTLFNMNARPTATGWWGPGWTTQPMSFVLKNRSITPAQRERLDLNGSDWGMILKFSFK